MSTATVAERLRDKLLNGEPINAAAVAKEFGCSRQQVTNVLLRFGAKKVGYGLWGCDDKNALLDWTFCNSVEDSAHKRRQHLRSVVPDGCRELMRVWGLTIEPITIPSRVSCRHVVMKLD